MPKPKKTYGSIDELKLMLTLYPNQVKSILYEAGESFTVMLGKDAFFVVAEDGNCAAFDENGKIVSSPQVIYRFMVPDALKKINIPEGVIDIESNAFEDIPQLEEVNLPSTLRWIHDWAFAGCNSLKKIQLPDGLERIGQYAFAWSGIEKLSIPKSVTHIGGCIGYKSNVKHIDLFYNSNLNLDGESFLTRNTLEEVVFKCSQQNDLSQALRQIRRMHGYPFGLPKDKASTIIKVAEA